MNYKNLKLEEFITNILGVELNEVQKHLVGMYEEIQNSKATIPAINPSEVLFRGNELIQPHVLKGSSADKSIFYDSHTICGSDSGRPMPS